MDRPPPDAAPRPLPGQPREIRNRAADCGWGFMAVWRAVLAAFTWIMARDGPHPSRPAWLHHGALALFWLLGLPAAGHFRSRPCTRLRIGPGGAAALARRTPFRREDESWPGGGIAAVQVRAGRDDEGDPYRRIVLVGRHGRERMIRDGRAPEEQEALAARLRAALGLGGPGPA